MKIYLIKKNNGQASIEMSLALVIAVLFLILSCNLFVWLNHNIVQRQKEYESTRTLRPGQTKQLNFYDPKSNPNYRPLSIFSLGGYKK